MSPRWRRIDESDNLTGCPGYQQMEMLYARIYTSGAGHRHSDTNQLIWNLKIAPDSSSQRLVYKRQAIRQFAQEVIDSLKARSTANNSNVITLIPMPPSKIRSDLLYDDRIEQVAQLIATEIPRADYKPLLRMTENHAPAHSIDGSRDPQRFYELMYVDEYVAEEYNPNSMAVIMDDVLTTGAHFFAAHKRLTERFEGIRVAGLFWAKAQRLEANSSFF